MIIQRFYIWDAINCSFKYVDKHRNYYRFLKTVCSGRSPINFEGKLIETCSFYLWIENIEARRSMLEITSRPVISVGQFSIEILKTL